MLSFGGINMDINVATLTHESIGPEELIILIFAIVLKANKLLFWIQLKDY